MLDRVSPSLEANPHKRGIVAEFFLKAAGFIACLALIAVSIFAAMLFVALGITVVIWIAVEAAIGFLLAPADCCWDDDGDAEIALDDD